MTTTQPPSRALMDRDQVWQVIDVSMRWPPPLPSARKLAGFRLTATDTPWSAGAGPEVHAPMSAILLMCAGRLAALPQLSGEGAPALAARLTAVRAS